MAIGNRPSAIAVIPARYASTRFPGKPLANRTGQYLIQHVVEQARQARRVSRVIVATDDERIADAVHSFGGQAMLTRADHPNGTSRIAEVVARLGGDPTPSLRHSVTSSLPPEIIVNVQGDEPEIEPQVIDQLVDGLAADPEAPMATLASPFAPDEDPSNPNIVKLVTATVNGRRRALYFSRALIPFDRDRPGASGGGGGKAGGVTYLKHPGLYAYRRDFLRQYVALPPTPLEQAEQLEQLRALEHGYPIAVIQTVTRHHGIDTPQQYEAFVTRWRADHPAQA